MYKALRASYCAICISWDWGAKLKGRPGSPYSSYSTAPSHWYAQQTAVLNASVTVITGML